MIDPRMLEARRGSIPRAIITGTAALGASVALTAVSAWLLARASEQPPILTLTVAIVTVRALGISRGLLRYLHRLDAHQIALRAVAQLRETLYTRLAQGRSETLLRLRRGDLLARLGADVDSMGEAIVRGWIPFAVGLAVLVLSSLAVFLILPMAGWVLAAALLLGGLVAPLLNARATHSAEQQLMAARGDLSARVMELLDGAEELRVSGGAEAHFNELGREEARVSGSIERSAQLTGIASALTTTALGTAVVGAAALGLVAFAQGQLGLPQLAVVLLTPLASAEGLSLLSPAASSIFRSRAATARLRPLLDDASPSAREPRDPHGPLRAEKLSCGWASSGPAVEGLTLEARPGTAVAIVGPSGCGKTTALLTLAGLLEPLGGSLRSPGPPSVTITAEDAHLFDATLLENLRAAGPEISELEAKSALERMGLKAWLSSLPAGLATRLGSQGHPVSGGERRRILLARALLTQASVLLLDEPTEHLDAGTADRILHDLLKGRRDRHGMVVVTHRLSGLEGFDEVLVLGPGLGEVGTPSRVLARGRHSDLLSSHSGYHAAWLAEQRDR